MTIIEKIKAEIERRIALYSSLSENTVNPNRIDEDRQILSFISSLESEKPMNQDGLKNEIERFFKDEGWDEYWKWVERPYQLMFGKTVIKFASNFYDLGCRRTAEKADEIEYNRQRAEESVPKDLEEAAERFSKNVSNGLYFRDLRVGFIAGAKWQKEQMMKAAVEGEVVLNPYPTICLDDCKDYDFKDGDKVRIIIVKEDKS